MEYLYTTSTLFQWIRINKISPPQCVICHETNQPLQQQECLCKGSLIIHPECMTKLKQRYNSYMICMTPYKISWSERWKKWLKRKYHVLKTVLWRGTIIIVTQAFINSYFINYIDTRIGIHIIYHIFNKIIPTFQSIQRSDQIWQSDLTFNLYYGIVWFIIWHIGICVINEYTLATIIHPFNSSPLIYLIQKLIGYKFIEEYHHLIPIL